MREPRNVVIIGGGIAGLCTAVYAEKCGYRVKVFEMNERPGGLATNWRRGDYTFETCLHWLLGSNPFRKMYARWAEVFDVDRLTWVEPTEYARMETSGGESLSIPVSPIAMETELIRQAPADAHEIRRLASAVRSLAKLEMPGASDPGLPTLLDTLRSIPKLPALLWWSSMSIREYGTRFTHPLLRAFCESSSGDLSAAALVLSLAWMSDGNASYPVGGSQAIIRLIAESFVQLGGQLRLGEKVNRVLVENDVAVGVELNTGKVHKADWVVSAADGHSTIFHMLGGKYVSEQARKVYGSWRTFPSYLQVSLGIAMNLNRHPGSVTQILDKPFEVDPGTRLNQVSFRTFNFDPTFAPIGKTAVTCFLPTYSYHFWLEMQKRAPDQYQIEKQRVARAVIEILEQRIPEVSKHIEVVDVSTPATVIRYTGNWRGSMEGWLLRPKSRFGSLQMRLPGLNNFLMVGHWVMPGGGLPSGLMTGRSAVQAMCKQDNIPFQTKLQTAQDARSAAATTA